MMAIVWDSLKYWVGRGLLYGAGLGTLYVTIGSENFNIAGGVILGAPFGAAAGFFAGLVDGVFIGLVCYFFFNPVRNPKRFRWIIIALTTVGTYIGTLFFLVILLPIPFSGQPGELNWHGISLFQVPALLAVAGVICVVFAFVKRYLKQHETPSGDVTSSADLTAQHPG